MQRTFRLRGRDVFKRQRTEGQSWRQPALIISMLPNNTTHNRYGFIITKRLGKAVVRNRLRRQLREIVRTFHSQLRTGYDIILIARPPAVEMTYWQLQEATGAVMQRAGLLI